jgi:hypothetical protein
MPTQLTHFTNRCVGLFQKSVVGEPHSALQQGDDGYAGWIIVAVHCLRKYPDQLYRRLLDVLHEMSHILAKLGVSVDEFLDFTTVCTRKQDLEMRIWRILLRSPASLHEFDDEFASAESTWQSINRYFGYLNGIKKIGHGEWDADLTEL